jgi:hypothetical protein
MIASVYALDDAASAIQLIDTTLPKGKTAVLIANSFSFAKEAFYQYCNMVSGCELRSRREIDGIVLTTGYQGSLHVIFAKDFQRIKYLNPAHIIIILPHLFDKEILKAISPNLT